jgi:uncharacterized DUF497 family protein
MQQYKVLQFAILYAIVLVEDKTLYEYFDFDIENAVFEWDEEKDRINYTKHGIHFKTAAKVFLDPRKMLREDLEHPEELRYDILGRVGKILFVVCVFKDDNVVRLISARTASVPEKERYEHGEDDI